jgi:(E)-4-hydroxy-3-methylbut-2-enyl-diphosphate synthase
MDFQIDRRKTSTIALRDIKIGGDHPITIQSMCNTHTSDIASTISQIVALQNAGCEIVRLAIPDMDSANAISQIRLATSIPLVADIHFDHRLAIQSIKNGIDGLRLNPGNIGSENKIKQVIDHAREKKIPIRIGVNSGSIASHLLQKYGVSATSMVESALEHVAILEKNNFDQVKISVKASSVPLTIQAYRLLAKRTHYPLHLGVTESGTEFVGTIKSAIGIGTLLAEGIGDTIRVSLTDDPVKEVKVAHTILKSLGYRKGLDIVSCPTCGRANIPLIDITLEVEKKLLPYSHLDITVAVMGCEVNGPGEAREADYGIAGGKKEGYIFKKGVIIKKVTSDNIVDSLIEEIMSTESI